jgi:hypothetical protein
VASSAARPPRVKAFSTVRNHTTTRLDPEGKEYIPNKIDPGGETKVSKHGFPLEGRVFRCRTFQLPDRGETLFMLGKDCAHVLGYLDSDLLFNRNRSLFEIIITQAEVEDLIQQHVIHEWRLPQPIAIVTARSMFRQFGARLIENGRRVQDDYWEAEAREQGFTAEDAAGEKRPGATKAEETTAAQASTDVVILSRNTNIGTWS